MRHDLDRLAPRPDSWTARRRKLARRPSVEGLEGRALLSVAGGPDLTFGAGFATNGYVPPPSGPGAYATSGSTVATASVVQSNGDIVEVGFKTYMAGFGSLTPFTQSFYATRFTPAGNTDPNFNSSPLFTAPSLTTTFPVNFQTSYARATGVALQSDNKIVVVGNVNGVAKVIRLNADGTFDTGFGTGGILTLGTVGSGDTILDYASAVSILPGGLIAVAGSSTPTAGQDTPAVEVLNSNGSVDTGYGTNGLSVVPLPSGAQAFAPIVPVRSSSNSTLNAPGPVELVQQADGSLVVAANAVPTGGVGNVAVLTRFTAAGAIDSTFGTAGQVILTKSSIFPSAQSVMAMALSIQPSGDLIVGGDLIAGFQTDRMIVVRLTPSGTFDTGFGVGGVNILPAVTTADQGVRAIATQADGRIVVASAFNTNFTRLDSNGLLDLTFGTAGQSLVQVLPPTIMSGPPNNIDGGLTGSGTVGLSFDATGKILAANSYGGLYRLLARGASNDFDYDGISDRTIYITSTGSIAYTPSGGGIGPIIQFGIPGAGQSIPVPGAYGGEGVDEPAVFFPSSSVFAVLSIQTGKARAVQFGVPGAGNSLPAPGDYDKSGATELAVYLPKSGIYVYRPAGGGADVQVQIGTPGHGDIPVPADYFGTGQDDVAVYDPTTATFLIQVPSYGTIVAIPFGVPGAGQTIPVPGDYDGSGHTESAIFLPSLAEFIYRPAAGGPDVVVPFGTPGLGNTLPAPGDYDGSGHTEIAAYLPKLGIFAYRKATGGDVYESIGIPNQTIPFVVESGTDTAGSPGSGFAIRTRSVPDSASGSAEIPLTPDVLDAIAGPTAKKKASTA